MYQIEILLPRKQSTQPLPEAALLHIEEKYIIPEEKERSSK